MPTAREVDGRCTSAIGRITEGSTRWRVLVETWPEANRYHGRFRFEPERAAAEDARESAALLQGDTVQEVLSNAYDLPEARLRRVLYSLT